MKRFITITTQFEGIHSYPDAPKEVEFLKYPHRHIFHIKIWLQTFSDNREVEFIMFKRFVNSILTNGDLKNQSCEMISDTLETLIKINYPNREIRIEVLEDNENGSYTEY